MSRSRWSIPLSLLFAARSAFGAEAAPPPRELETFAQVEAIDSQLKAGEWAAARSAAQALLDREGAGQSPPVERLLSQLAFAEAALGELQEGRRHWGDALALSPSIAASLLLKIPGPAADALRDLPARGFGERPPGVEGLEARAGYTPARRTQGEDPPASGHAVRGPQWARLQAVIDVQGQLSQPSVFGPDASFSRRVLEAARSWKFEPAQLGGSPVSGLYEVLVNPPALRTFAELAPGAPEVPEIVALLAKGDSRGALARAETALTETLDRGAPSRGYAATLMALKALALAGRGDKDSGVCLWQAAQGVAPALYHLDLASFGAAGQLLSRNRFGALLSPPGKPRPPSSPGAQVQKPDLIRSSVAQPSASRLARAARSHGSVVIEATIGEDGRLHDPLISHTEGVLFGFDVASLGAACQWRFKPAELEGRPVKVWYVVTFNLNSQAPAAP